MALKNFPFKLSEKIDGKIIKFQDVAEIREWLKNESVKWSWLNANSYQYPFNQASSHINSIFSNASSIVANIENSIASNLPYDQHLSLLDGWFVTEYNRKKSLIPSWSREFKFIDQMKDNHSAEAAFLAGFATNAQGINLHNPMMPAYSQALHSYLNFTSGLSTDSLNIERAKMDEITSEAASKMDAFQERQEAFQKNFESLLNSTNTLIAEFTKKFESFRDKGSIELEDLKKTYDQFMSLKAPVDYWKQKRKYHQIAIRWFSAFSILIGLAGGAAIIFGTFELLGSENSTVPYWKITVLVISGTLFFWLERLLVKLLLSNIHLEADAHERETMSMTYLSLLRDGSGIDEDDKKLILTTLFRPGTPGLIKDDGIPPGFWDLVTKGVSK